MIDLSDVTLLTATFNRHDFTVSMLRSFFDVFHIMPPTVILDNSTTTPFVNIPNKYIHVIDNTNFKYTLDYNQPSKNHCASLDWVLHNEIKTKFCMLCDNDIIFKPTVLNLISDFKQFNAVGEIGYDRVPPARLYPYFCIIDMNFMLSNHIRYFDTNRCMIDNATMDTGCSFYLDLTSCHARIKNIRLSDYVIHLKGGTLHNKTLDELLARA